MSDQQEFDRKRKNAELYGIDLTNISKYENKVSILSKRKKKKIINSFYYEEDLEFTVIDYSLKYPCLKLSVNDKYLEELKEKWTELECNFNKIIDQHFDF
jgi:hypothetical protein